MTKNQSGRPYIPKKPKTSVAKNYRVVEKGHIPSDLTDRVSALHAAALLKTADRRASSPTPTTKSKVKEGKVHQ